MSFSNENSFFYNNKRDFLCKNVTKIMIPFSIYLTLCFRTTQYRDTKMSKLKKFYFIIFFGFLIIVDLESPAWRLRIMLK